MPLTSENMALLNSSPLPNFCLQLPNATQIAASEFILCSSENLPSRMITTSVSTVRTRQMLCPLFSASINQP